MPEILLETNYPSARINRLRFKYGVQTNFGLNSSALDSDVLINEANLEPKFV